MNVIGSSWQSAREMPKDGAITECSLNIPNARRKNVSNIIAIAFSM